uniref:C-type lectin domain-containing protein n=1 Tax=Panagrolaimus sp. PS1159 TaxID=55785 RepID=A0AC35FUK5_9BILA
MHSKVIKKKKSLPTILQLYLFRCFTANWARVFGEPEESAPIQWKNGADKSSLENSECPNYGVVFNYKTAKFDIKHFDEEHYSVCETPRWAKLQCDWGWHLVPQLRMCLNIHLEAIDYLQAHSTCNSEGSFIATAQNMKELAMLRNVIFPYILPRVEEKKFFWAGLKSEYRTTYAMDGTNPLFNVAGSNPGDKKCVAFSHFNFCEFGLNECDTSLLRSGFAAHCLRSFPFMCQKFADQSIVKSI